jgi:urease accessory protein
VAPAREHRLRSFSSGRCRQRFEIHGKDGPICIERASYEGGSAIMGGRFGLGGASVVGTLFATPASPKLLELARAVPAPPGELVSSTLLGTSGEVLGCRYLGQGGARGRDYLARVWSAIRPALLGKAAVWPRIWST